MQGGEVFVREIDGEVHTFELAGVWGGGSTITERDLAVTGDNTVYSMWDGYGIVGARRGDRLATYPALWGRITLKTFRERYTKLGGRCRVMSGEVLGPDCDEYCAIYADKCPNGPFAPATCAETCAKLPRSILDCVADYEDICSPHECRAIDRVPPEVVQ